MEGAILALVGELTGIQLLAFASGMGTGLVVPIMVIVLGIHASGG